MLVEYIQR